MSVVVEHLPSTFRSMRVLTSSALLSFATADYGCECSPIVDKSNLARFSEDQQKKAESKGSFQRVCAEAADAATAALSC